MSDFTPPTPQSIPVRPLTRGMVSNRVSSEMPAGSGKVVRGMRVEPRGLKRRASWNPFLSLKDSYGQIATLAAGEVVQEYLPFWKSDGSFQLLCLTNRRLRRLTASDSTWVEIPSVKTYTITGEAGNVYTCAGENFVTDGIRVGDMARIIVGSSVVETAVTLASGTDLTVAAAPAGRTSANLVIAHTFAAAQLTVVDRAYIPNGLVLTDGTAGGIWKYDGSVLTLLGVHAAVGDPDPDYLTGARSVYYFAGLLWLGNTLETGSDGKRFVRWSSATDITEFAAADYVFFSNEKSSVLCVRSVEDIPVVFLEAGIYNGFPSDVVGLPYLFTKVETGGLSAASMRGIVSAQGSLYFVGFDNAYQLVPGRLGTRQSLVLTDEIFGNPVADAMFKDVQNVSHASALFDRNTGSLVFSVDTSSDGRIARVFYYSLRTKAWSYDDEPYRAFTSLSSLPYIVETLWDDLDTVTWAELLAQGSSWLSLSGASDLVWLMASGPNGEPYVASSDGRRDSLVVGTPPAPLDSEVSTEFQTGDFDFGDPDFSKVLVRVSLKVSEVDSYVRTDNAEFDVQVSEDEGLTWVSKGTASVEPGSYVEEVHCRSRSDVLRVRILGSDVPPIMLEEVILRVRGAGLRNDRS